MADVLIVRAADDEYVAALRWYADKSIIAAVGFEAAIASAINSELLGNTPKLYAII